MSVGPGMKMVKVQVAWTESRNYTATIETSVPTDAQPHEIRSILEDGDYWYELVRLQCAEIDCLDSVEHRQALDYQISDK